MGAAGRRSLEAGRGRAPSKPVILYPQPAAFSAHPLISIDRSADELIDALMSESLLELAWEEHGFRGPLGTIGKARNPLLQSRLARADRRRAADPGRAGHAGPA